MAYQDHTESVTRKAAGLASDVADGAAKAAEKLQADSAGIRRDVASRAAGLSDQLEDTVKRLGVDTAELKGAVGDAWDALEERFRVLIRRRPIRAVVISAALGILLSVVSRS